MLSRSSWPRLRAEVSASLFPRTASGGAGRGHRARAWGVLAAVLVLGALLNLLRIGWSASLHTVWAEDGPIYLQAALTQGFWHAVFAPYAGYLVVMPRLIVEAATAVPLADAPAVIAVLSALLAALSGVAVWFAAAGHVRSPQLRAGLVVAVVLAASAGQETLDSAAYVPWFMLVAAFWLLFLRPRTDLAAGLAALFLLATGLSTPGVWFFAPVALLRLATARDRRDAILLGGFGLGAAAQVPVVLSQQQDSSLWTSHIWTAYLQRVVDGGLLGQRLGGNLWEQLGWSFLVVLCVAALIGFAVGLRRTSARARWFAALALPTSFAMFVVSVYQRGAGETAFWASGSSGGSASRYTLVPALLLLSSALAILDGLPLARSARPARGLSIAAVAAILIAVASSFDMSDPAERGHPYWRDALQAAAHRCLAHREETAGIATAPPPFGVQLPCARVASFADEESSGG